MICAGSRKARPGRSTSGSEGFWRRGALHPAPVDPPAAAWHFYPSQLLLRGSPSVMVERRCPLIKAAGVRGASKSKQLAIQVMTELVAKSAEEGSVRGHLLAHGGAGPNTDQRGLQIVVSEEFDGAAFAHAQRTSSEDTDFGPLDPVEVGGYGKEVAAGIRDGRGFAAFYGGLDRRRPCEQAPVGRHAETYMLVAAEKLREQLWLPRWRIGEHFNPSLAEDADSRKWAAQVWALKLGRIPEDASGGAEGTPRSTGVRQH